MSMQSMSASHQVSISHDPLEERQSAGADQYGARDNWPSGGRRPQRASFGRSSSMLPSIDSTDLRPVLLAGAIGLFAAWLVSGMSASRGPQRSSGTRGGRYVADRHDGGSYRNRPQPTRGPRDAYAVGGPEGRSSREEFELDAMNP